MKLLLGLLVSLAISSAFALPARPKDEVDVIDVPRGPQRSREYDAEPTDDGTDSETDFRNFKGVVDTGAGYPFLSPLPHPFSFNLGFFDSFEDIFRRLRTRLLSSGDSDESSEEGGFPLSLAPPKGANTTSVVKVVDGHKIEINDTVYGNGDGSNGAVFKFRVINIRPLDSDEEVSEGEKVITQAPTTAETQKPRDIEGDSEEKGKSEENEINANIDDPESTTEAITTEMHDTVPHRIPSFDNNAVDNDSPVNQDELQAEDDAGVTTTEAIKSLDDDVATTLDEDATNTNLDGNTMKSEKLSALVDAENVNDDDEDTEQPATNKSIDESDEDRSIDDNQSAEEIEAIEELLEQRQKLKEVLEQPEMQELVDTVGEHLTMADPEEERFADEVEKMLSVGELHSQEGHQQHSLREDLTSSDDEEDAEDVNDVSYHGLNSEWGDMDDKNILTNEIDVYESVPIDLSNDIAVNDIMADQGAPADPDAEVFNVDEFAPRTARHFEVLKDIK